MNVSTYFFGVDDSDEAEEALVRQQRVHLHSVAHHVALVVHTQSPQRIDLHNRLQLR